MTSVPGLSWARQAKERADVGRAEEKMRSAIERRRSSEVSGTLWVQFDHGRVEIDRRNRMERAAAEAAATRDRLDREKRRAARTRVIVDEDKQRQITLEIEARSHRELLQVELEARREVRAQTRNMRPTHCRATMDRSMESVGPGWPAASPSRKGLHSPLLHPGALDEFREQAIAQLYWSLCDPDGEGSCAVAVPTTQHAAISYVAAGDGGHAGGREASTLSSTLLLLHPCAAPSDDSCATVLYPRRAAPYASGRVLSTVAACQLALREAPSHPSVRLEPVPVEPYVHVLQRVGRGYLLRSAYARLISDWGSASGDTAAAPSSSPPFARGSDSGEQQSTSFKQYNKRPFDIPQPSTETGRLLHLKLHESAERSQNFCPTRLDRSHIVNSHDAIDASILHRRHAVSAEPAVALHSLRLEELRAAERARLSVATPTPLRTQGPLLEALTHTAAGRSLRARGRNGEPTDTSGFFLLGRDVGTLEPDIGRFVAHTLQLTPAERSYQRSERLRQLAQRQRAVDTEVFDRVNAIKTAEGHVTGQMAERQSHGLRWLRQHKAAKHREALAAKEARALRALAESRERFMQSDMAECREVLRHVKLRLELLEEDQETAFSRTVAAVPAGQRQIAAVQRLLSAEASAVPARSSDRARHATSQASLTSSSVMGPAHNTTPDRLQRVISLAERTRTVPT
jgi:hypothetical protein